MYWTIAKYLLPALAALGLVWFIYNKGYNTANTEWTAKESTARIQFQQQLAERDQKNQQIVDQERTLHEQEQAKQLANAIELNVQLDSMRKQSSDYVATIERLSGENKTACNSALELANRQYNELADFARQASNRADTAAEDANSMNAYINNVH